MSDTNSLMSGGKLIQVNEQQAKLLTPDGGLHFKSSPGEDVFFKIGGDEVDGLLDYFEIRVGYLEGPPLHIHSLQHETFHIIEGELTVKVGDELVTAKTGDFLYIPKGVIHTYVNLKEGSIARAVGNLAPGGFYKFVEELNHYQTTAHPPERAKVEEISAKHNQVFVGPPLAVSMGLRAPH